MEPGSALQPLGTLSVLFQNWPFLGEETRDQQPKCVICCSLLTLGEHHVFKSKSLGETPPFRGRGVTVEGCSQRRSCGDRGCFGPRLPDRATRRPATCSQPPTTFV